MKATVVRVVGIATSVVSFSSFAAAEGAPGGASQHPVPPPVIVESPQVQPSSAPTSAASATPPLGSASPAQQIPASAAPAFPPQPSRPAETALPPSPYAATGASLSGTQPVGPNDARTSGPSAALGEKAQPEGAKSDASVAVPGGSPPVVQAGPASKASGVTVAPYGYVKFGASYDSARTAYGDIAFFVLPASRAGGGKRELTFSARETRLGLKLAAPASYGIVPTGQIEADWFEEAATAGKYSPRLRLAFLDLALGKGWSVRAGQDWDVFVSVHPKLVDPGILGGSGHVYGRRPQVRVTKVVKFNDTDGLAFKVAAAHGRSQDLDADGQIDAEAAAVPTVQGSVVVSVKLLGKKPTQLEVSTAYGKEKLNLPIATDTTKPNHRKTFDSLLLHAGLLLPLGEIFSLQGTVFWGKNIDQYLGGIIQGINVGTERTIESAGGWGQLVAEVLPVLTVTAGYGAENPVNADLPASGRTFNSRAFGNVFVSVTPEATVALEYGYLTTEFGNEKTQHDNRGAVGFQYSF
jgi:hypothetical protein